MKQYKKRYLAGILAFFLAVAVIPVQTVSAAPAKLSEKDFTYYSNGYEMSFLEVEDPWGRVSHIASKQTKTYRGIQVGSKLSDVKKKYGKASREKFDTKDSFNKYIKQYYFQYGMDISTWKNYVEYTYKKNTKNDRRLRFYLNKKDKVAAVVYIYKYKNYKLSNKSVPDIGLSFESLSGKKITQKKIDGKTVSVLPADAKLSYDMSKLPDGLLADVRMYDKQNRLCGETSPSINLSLMWTHESKLETLLESSFTKWNPSNGKTSNFNRKKLGSYKYFELILYDVDVKGGYGIPRKYYFQFK